MIFMVLTKSWKTRKRSKMAKNGHFAPLSKPLNRGGVPLYGKRLVAPGDHFSRFLDPPPGGGSPPLKVAFFATPHGFFTKVRIGQAQIRSIICFVLQQYINVQTTQKTNARKIKKIIKIHSLNLQN